MQMPWLFRFGQPTSILNDANSVTANSQKLQSAIANIKEQQPNASFYLITDGQGKTVAQSIQIVKDDGFGISSSSH